MPLDPELEKKCIAVTPEQAGILLMHRSHELCAKMAESDDVITKWLAAQWTACMMASKEIMGEDKERSLATLYALRGIMNHCGALSLVMYRLNIDEHECFTLLGEALIKMVEREIKQQEALAEKPSAPLH